MIEEGHRRVCLAAIHRYFRNDLKVWSFPVPVPKVPVPLPPPFDGACIYVVRLDPQRTLSADARAIPNARDPKHILYIGGHESGNATGRVNALIVACRQAEQYFVRDGYARNETRLGHKVAQCLTTGLLQTGFRISDCIVDIIEPEADKFNELELIIGYQETFFHLPPWNGIRGGISAFPQDKRLVSVTPEQVAAAWGF